MNYLTRDERREVILKAAMQVALSGGFTAMTVRHIATIAGVASGQVHHHFTSIGELKALAFVRLIREMLDMPLVPDDANWRERLFAMVGSDDGRLEPYIRLWREAQLLADSLAQPAAPVPHETLSEREMQTLLKIASGQRQTDIAQELMLSPKTVSVYRARVLEKLGMSSNAELTAYAIKNGLIDTP